jgi:glyceraldehyde-3-phosphate dehydrogenase/erythrose-4-phosphate dehydrogenase
VDERGKVGIGLALRVPASSVSITDFKVNRDARPSNEKASSTLARHSDFICRKKGLDK